MIFPGLVEVGFNSPKPITFVGYEYMDIMSADTKKITTLFNDNSSKMLESSLNDIFFDSFQIYGIKAEGTRTNENNERGGAIAGIVTVVIVVVVVIVVLRKKKLQKDSSSNSV